MSEEEFEELRACKKYDDDGPYDQHNEYDHFGERRRSPNRLPSAFSQFLHERAMNRIHAETDQRWEKKRSLLASQVNDFSKYNLMSVEEFEESRAREKYDDNGPYDRHNEYDNFGERRRSLNRLP